jgi:hypothetical protein
VENIETNFDKLKEMKLKDVFEFLGFEKDVQQNVFLIIFQLINCRYCPAQKDCSNGEICQKTQKNWLEKGGAEE